MEEGRELFSQILLIEDEPAHAELIKRALRGLCAEVELARTGGEALEKLATLYPEVVLCDLHLPDMTALEILRQIKAFRPHLPFIVLTSSNDIESAVSCMRNGASDFMVKSFSDDLRGRIELTLARISEEISRREKEIQLRLERDAFWTAAHATTDGLAILGSDGAIVFQNRAFSSFCRSIDPEGSEGDIVKLIDRVNPVVSAALKSELSGRSVTGLWRSDLAVNTGPVDKPVIRHFELSLSVVSRSEEDSVLSRKVVLWCRDITGKKDQERINRELLATTTHDLKGPLGAIINSIELLEQMLPDREAKVDELLTRVASCSRNCISMIDELLSARRIQDGVFKVRPRNLDAASELEDMVLDYLPMAKSRGIKLYSRQIEKTIVYADTIGFKRVLGNLVSNALKFTKAGGEVELSAERTGSEVKVSVRDTGAGIAKEMLHTLFEKYGRLDRDQDIEGSGLGLFVTKNIVDAHSGRIEIKSELNVGTTFTVVFPDEETVRPSQVP
jgi:CheY-like chemotaxis protein/anti-sigma regulatory factor (Ser/Thr protein kinase)